MEKRELQEMDREVTRTEKVLAMALVVFLLIGGLRIAADINAVFPYPDYMELRGQFIPAPMEQEINNLRQQQNEKLANLQRLQENERDLRLEYEVAREEYRTLLDRGIDDREKKARWEQARTVLEKTISAVKAAETDLRDFQTNSLGPQEKVYMEAENRLQQRLGQLTRHRDLQAGLALMAYALAVFALSLWVASLFRTKPLLSRYAVIGTSFLGFGVLQMLVISYRVGYPFLHGLLPIEWIISLAGSGLSVAGIIFLKNKYLSPEAIKSRRLWKKACPGCGFQQPGNYCLRCGLAQKHHCSNCGLQTNKFSPWCEECGSKQS